MSANRVIGVIIKRDKCLRLRKASLRSSLIKVDFTYLSPYDLGELRSFLKESLCSKNIIRFPSEMRIIREESSKSCPFAEIFDNASPEEHREAPVSARAAGLKYNI